MGSGVLKPVRPLQRLASKNSSPPNIDHLYENVLGTSEARQQAQNIKSSVANVINTAVIATELKSRNGSSCADTLHEEQNLELAKAKIGKLKKRSILLINMSKCQIISKVLAKLTMVQKIQRALFFFEDQMVSLLNN